MFCVSRFWTSHKIGAGVFYVALVLHPLPGALRRVENPFALNVSPLEWGYSDTWVRSPVRQPVGSCRFTWPLIAAAVWSSKTRPCPVRSQVWVSIPILIRLADRSIRWWRRNRRPSRILGAEFMGDDIVALRISRPKSFSFRCQALQPEICTAVRSLIVSTDAHTCRRAPTAGDGWSETA